ncbi:5-oxoprolinase subunit C family protein [Kangiella koreensis]|uniref:Urea amidolyase related protein n=1 Tax=Kangiella koreensis (strain DSM 16069 / JCM 12317 / KCTC 12182 / SW-125) TaxID=523791 RepID=C7R8W7_KANKD|nr:biotin-dependent carboxyltransferase family protein [Kangiella koreensis]ACV25980.1 urea amidolyase related protein [Kangiella koreensis DSM 16069]
MSIRFIKAGLQTSLQDLGRTGFRRYGIPNNGALDPVSLQIANWLVSKPLNSACLEITQAGPVIEFTQDMAIAVTGAHFELSIDDIPVDMHQTLLVSKGERLTFGKLVNGARAYLAFSAAPDLPKIMDSHSTNLMASFGGFEGSAFNNNDTLTLKNFFMSEAKETPKELQLQFGDNYQIRFIEGREWTRFSDDMQKSFIQSPYQVTSHSNRMGMRLKGEALKTEKALSMTTAPITPGTIQIPPDGQPIITLADGQTTGGYPRIGQVITADLPILGQLKANDSISFQPVDIDDAIELLKEKTNLMEQLLDVYSDSSSAG